MDVEQDLSKDSSVLLRKCKGTKLKSVCLIFSKKKLKRWGELFYSIDETAHPSVYHVVSVYLSQLDNDNIKIAGCAFSSIEKKNLPMDW